MRILTLTQPWATLMAIGAKTYETRSWGTKYRGSIAIHAAKGWPDEYKRMCVHNEPFSTTLAEAGFTNLRSLLEVTGHILCVVDLVDVLPTHGFVNTHRFAHGALPAPALHEEAFGDYTPGRFAWATTNLRRLPVPVPATGAQGLREIGDVPRLAVLEQLGAAA